MKLNSLVFLFLFCVSVLHAQVNLVPNPSFEDTVSCPDWISDMSVVGWTSPTTASPDYFHSCNSTNAGVPQNVFGYQNARTGYGYVGVLLSDFSSTDYREYVQCQLILPLEAGKNYEVRFYVSRTDSSTKASDNFGAYFSATPVTSTDNLNLPYVPQVVSEPNNPITNDTDWVQVVDTFLAAGGEQFLTLGVFTDNVTTNWITVGGGWESEAHYYIDDVSVTEVLGDSILEHARIQISMFPNPTDGVINVSSAIAMEKVNVYSSLGLLVISLSPQSNNLRIDLSGYSDGIYFLDIMVNEAVVRKKIVIKH